MTRKESTGDSSESVAVAVHIRPLIDQELEQGCAECIHVPSPGSSQVVTGAHDFTYDHVFGGDFGKDSSQLYDECVSPLVDGLFQGYNATVLAYGQTGSGKTYTMGSAFPQMCASEEQGVIPRVMDSIFGRIRSMKDTKEFTVKVGFVEIHKEEIKDLLSARTSKCPAVHIREVPGGGIVLAGAHEVEVTNQEDMVAVLERGTCLRATGATGMNQRSSRSHAIFTITVEQKTLDKEGDSLKQEDSKDLTDDGADTESEDEDEDFYLCAKMHLVDLAGSERVKRTKNEGQRLQEGIKINRGLLALGNVINALSENKQHVPYRDSKLTRMLQDSLGGNSRTLMIACVSPADINLEESLNSLRYASRARAIKNKPIVNRDPIAAQIYHLRHQLALARAENADLRRQLGISPSENLQDQHSVEDLQLELESTRTQLARLTVELGEAKRNNEELKTDLQEQAEEALIAAMQRDKMAQALSTHIGQDKAEKMISEIGASLESGFIEEDLLKKVQRLEEENRSLRAGGVQPSMHARIPHSPVSDDMPSSPAFSADGLDDIEGSHRQQEIDSMNAEMYRLQSDLEAKEAAIRKVTGHVSMQVAYKSQLKEIEKQRDSLAKERKSLLNKIKDLQDASVEERTKLERMYKCKLRDLDLKVKAAEKRERKIRSLEATQQRAAQKVKDLEGEVQNIKTQKAMLQRQADKAGKDFTQWKRQRDKEVLKLKKDHQSTTVQLVKLEAQNSRQQAYLRRKIEEAAAARKRLANLEGRRAAARATNKHRLSDSAKAKSLQADVGEWVESELDSCCSSIELQKVLEGEKASRSEVARELRQVEKRIAALKNPKWWGLSPGMNKDQKQLEQLKKSLLEKSEYHGKQIQEIQLSLMQMRAAEEERGQGAADPKRWDNIATVEDAQTSLVTLFVAASKYKTQAYEFQSSLSDLSEEVEMLKLKLEVAEAERLEQAMQMDQMRKASATSVQTTPPPPVKSQTDDTEVKEVLHELDSVQFETHDDDGESEVTSSTAETSKELLPGEIAALGHMNTLRASQGLSPVYTLSKKDLQERLQVITLSNGQMWKPGSKSKAEMISDYLALVVSKPTPSSRGKSSPLQGLKSLMRMKQAKSPDASLTQQENSPSVIRAIDLESPKSHGSNGLSDEVVGDARAVLSTVTSSPKSSPPKEHARQRRQTSNEKKKIWIPAS
jgi:hypothetical protein